jgi:hypothetical protein
MGPNATNPLINLVLNESFYQYLSSGGYVANQNRLDWKWWVRAQIGGQWGEWSGIETFDVEPVNSDTSN